MKKMVCEVCEGTAFVKEDGKFTCQSCGMQYSIEEAKNLLKEVDGEAITSSPAARSDESKVQNFMQLAESAIEKSNNAQAEDYANKILEIDGENARAWMIKGEAVAWQSTVARPRLDEAIGYWKLGLSYTAEEDLENQRDYVKRHCEGVIKAMINIHADNFSTLQSEANVNYLKGDINTILNTAISTIPLHVFLDTDDLIQHACVKMNAAAVAGSDDADKDFGTERREKTKYAWERWMKATDYCILLLDYALGFCKQTGTADQIFKNLEILENNCIGSCSYRFEANGYTSGYVTDFTLTESAKSFRRNHIAKAKTKRDKVKKEIQDKRREKYWENHAEQKQKLEDEKAELKGKIKTQKEEVAKLDKEISAQQGKINELKKKYAVAGTAEQKQNELAKKIASMKGELSSLGLFKGKQKKALAAQIEEAEGQKAALQPEVDAYKAEQDKKMREEGAPYADALKKAKTDKAAAEKDIKDMEKRIKEIDNELTKPR